MGPVTVLMFHHIGELKTRAERAHHLSLPRFRGVLAGLQNLGCNFAPVSALVSQEPSQTPSVALTFDDGYEDFQSNVLPILSERGLPATVFVVTSQIGGTNAWDSPTSIARRPLLNRHQLRELTRHGIEIGAHSITHAWLPSLSDVDLRSEVTDSKAQLEDLLGAAVDTFAYPYGGFDLRVRAAVAAAGYRIALTTDDSTAKSSDPLAVGRIGIAQRDSTWSILGRLRECCGRSDLPARLAMSRAWLIAERWRLSAGYSE